ncbi:MAG: hypothetical protein E6Q50_13345 [Lysobacter sp.]|nr:MAG: hypothetical protein E6Q50_13345 [Lysobacter sp.]
MTHAAPDPLRFAIPADHPCLPGHFPGRPVVPGVVMLDRVFAAIEAAEAGPAADLVAAAPPSPMLRLPQVKFVQPLLPAQAARIELERLSSPDAAPRWRFRVLREADGALLATGETQALADAAAA